MAIKKREKQEGKRREKRSVGKQRCELRLCKPNNNNDNNNAKRRDENEEDKDAQGTEFGRKVRDDFGFTQKKKRGVNG